MAWRAWAGWCVVALVSCQAKGSASTRPSATAEAAVHPQPPAFAISSAAPAAASIASASASPGPVAPLVPGRPPASRGEACHLLKGPIQLAVTGVATVWMPEDARPDQDPQIAFNRDGVAKKVTLPASPAPRADTTGKPSPSAAKKDDRPSRPERLALAEPPERATSPGCARAGGHLFCMAANGDIHRTTLAGDGDVTLAKGRPGTPLAATVVAGNHVVYAFLADRKTSEGVQSLAFVALDESTPLLLSEDGSGATFVALAPRGPQVVAMYVDARRAMTPLHARVLSTDTGRVRLGGDAVLFVGEGSETRVAGALVLGESGPAFGLLPGFKDATTFGVAAIRIDEQPRDDAPVTWSTYPSGMERAAIAATSGVTPRRVLLARPASSEPKAKRVLELGEIEDTGAFKGLCTVAEGASFSDLGVLADRFGTLWLTYTDAEGTWIERRGKPF